MKTFRGRRPANDSDISWKDFIKQSHIVNFLLWKKWNSTSELNQSFLQLKTNSHQEHVISRFFVSHCGLITLRYIYRHIFKTSCWINSVCVKMWLNQQPPRITLLVKDTLLLRGVSFPFQLDFSKNSSSMPPKWAKLISPMFSFHQSTEIVIPTKLHQNSQNCKQCIQCFSLSAIISQKILQNSFEMGKIDYAPIFVPSIYQNTNSDETPLKFPKIASHALFNIAWVHG